MGAKTSTQASNFKAQNVRQPLLFIIRLFCAECVFANLVERCVRRIDNKKICRGENAGKEPLHANCDDHNLHMNRT